ncbi:MAG: DUF2332 domain-containing protein, partial [Actinobacteria bacterium]|nr:DUF2332 domain-containing protein [Actinomycetota bacterium]
MDHDRLARWFERFAELECPDLPLYHRLCLEAAHDVALLDQVLTAAPGQWRPNLLLAALHDLVLQFPDEPLARWYPTVGGDPTRSGDLMADVHAMIAAHPEPFAEMLRGRSTQTNEVNRTALYPPSLGALGHLLTGRDQRASLIERGVAWVEIGASAGLNLAFDDYRIAYDGLDRTIGDGSSTVRLRCEARGDLDAMRDAVDFGTQLPIASRIGLDIAPVDLDDAADRRWLKACIWPEQLVRHERFDAAADHVAALRREGAIEIVRDVAVDGLFEVIEVALDAAEANGFDDSVVVVINSWVMTYLPTERRAAVDAALDLIGGAQTLVH